ncbi:clathrin interactor EPSIN 2-like isoform X2 [Ananas comosus]|nr:clathrin interactor EPSIN 2-like isoform X2 [Ananas comosus]
MNVIWKRINDTGKNWRHVYKALTVLDYLVAHGSERVIDDIREHSYQISTLSDFQYIDSSGRDQGSNVRRKSQSLVSLVNDKERIQEVRQKAVATRDKYRSTFSTGGTNRPSSYSGAGGYGDRYDDDRYENRYGGRDDERNGNGREREWGYRDDDRYGGGGDSYYRDGDRYARDTDERYGRESNYRADEYRGARGNDDYSYGSRNRSFDRDRDRSHDDDDRYSSRSDGGKHDDPPQDESRLEQKLSKQSVDAPPSYEEAIGVTQNQMNEERNGGTSSASAPKVTSPTAPRSSSSSGPPAQATENVTPVEKPLAENNGGDGFDEFDPRGPVSATTQPAASSLEMDLFGSLSATDTVNSLALVPITTIDTSPEPEIPANSGFGTSNFVAQPSASTAMNEPSNNNPFGDAPFLAIPQENLLAQQPTPAPVSPFQPNGLTGGGEPLPSMPPKMETHTNFDFGDALGGLTYAPSVPFGQQDSSPCPPFLVEPQASMLMHGTDVPSTAFQQPGPTTFNPLIAQPAMPTSIQPGQTSFVPQPFTGTLPSQGAQPAAPPNMHINQSSSLMQSNPSAPFGSQPTPPALHATQPVNPTNTLPSNMNLLPQSAASAPVSEEIGPNLSSLQPAKTEPTKKFEPKSAVWADTLSRGLVNLNISGPKINPHADIGVDFDSINRKEKREEKKSSTAPVTSTVTMGKAMGAGSGIGRAVAGSMAPPPNAMVGSGMGMGMGMGGYGGTVNQPMAMGMGMNMGMGMGMGMNMGMGQGMPMRPPTGMPPSRPAMPGAGYNPMMSSGYGAQQPFGSGYR